MNRRDRLALKLARAALRLARPELRARARDALAVSSLPRISDPPSHVRLVSN